MYLMHFKTNLLAHDSTVVDLLVRQTDGYYLGQNLDIQLFLRLVFLVFEEGNEETKGRTSKHLD